MITSKALRFFVIIEVLVCFVPLAALLCLGLLFAPFALLDMLKGRVAGTMNLAAVICGIAGLIALVQVLKWLFGRQANLLGRWWTLALMLLGLLPFLLIFGDALFDADGVFFDGEPLWYMNVAWATPILVTAHLAYLARQYLFRQTGKP